MRSCRPTAPEATPRCIRLGVHAAMWNCRCRLGGLVSPGHRRPSRALWSVEWPRRRCHRGDICAETLWPTCGFSHVRQLVYGRVQGLCWNDVFESVNTRVTDMEYVGLDKGHRGDSAKWPVTLDQSDWQFEHCALSKQLHRHLD